jgi:hypothetical protein
MTIKHKWDCEAKIYSTNVITATPALTITGTADFDLHMEELGTNAMCHYDNTAI